MVGDCDLLLKCSSLIHSELKGLELSMETMETLGTLSTLENWPQLEFQIVVGKVNCYNYIECLNM